MKGELWTGRVYDYKKIRERYPDAELICVMRYSPRYISLKKEGISHFLSLSPKPGLLEWVKNAMESEEKKVWFQFLQKFKNQLKYDSKYNEDRFFIRRLLLKGKRVVLLCHEKPDEKCHRKVLPFLILNDDERELYKGEIFPSEEMEQTQLDW